MLFSSNLPSKYRFFLLTEFAEWLKEKRKNVGSGAIGHAKKYLHGYRVETKPVQKDYFDGEDTKEEHFLYIL